MTKTIDEIIDNLHKIAPNLNDAITYFAQEDDDREHIFGELKSALLSYGQSEREKALDEAIKISDKHKLPSYEDDFQKGIDTNAALISAAIKQLKSKNHE